MTDHRIDPRGIKPSSTNGDVLSTTGGVASWGAAPASGVQSIVAGTNVTVDNSDPVHPIVSAGSGELLMADGVTSPPVPIENEAGDDWLYQD